MSEIYTCFFHSPIGIIKIVANDTHLLSVNIAKKLTKCTKSSRPLQLCLEQLSEYFSGKRKKFDLPLEMEGTPFEKQVWVELSKIPYGKVISYKDLAQKAGKPKAFRAVGNANSKNKFPIILPCHRVIASNGALGGYGLGLDRKEKLLIHEKVPLTWPLNIPKLSKHN